MLSYYWNRQHTSMETVPATANLLSARSFDSICGKGDKAIRGN